jgi:hypothetical protein
MAGYKQKGMNFGKGTGYTGNPGDKWNETWNTPDYNENRFTISRYGLGPEDTMEGKMGEDRLDNLPEYTRDKTINRSNVLAERKINELNRQEGRVQDVQGSDLTKRQRRLLGKGKSDRAMKIARRKARRQIRRNARNN